MASESTRRSNLRKAPPQSNHRTGASGRGRRMKAQKTRAQNCTLMIHAFLWVCCANRDSSLHQSNFARVPSSRPRVCPPRHHPSRHVEAPRPLRSVSACAKCQLATPLSRSGQAPPRPAAVQGAPHFHLTTHAVHSFTHDIQPHRCVSCPVSRGVCVVLQF